MTAKLPNSLLAHLEAQPRFVDLDENGHIDQLKDSLGRGSYLYSQANQHVS
ncbi:hypothetical protein COMA1_11070 [Candidatus Nitrospira nitrosa]|uniref:Uncharacterized protein n=1 Tax=Candidatus Nitrospira nitrosa TaxID=1742972 RepID=A0A0S4L6H2_9BACT|nr:hypothetical protein COMA1_11070 [Candidatus Nitrospira nitrosa]